MSTFTSRYVRTHDHRRRRLSLHHAEQWRKARALADDILTARELVHAWHISGPFGYKPAGIGPAPRCLSRLRRERDRRRWDEAIAELDAASVAARRRWAMDYWRVRPFSNGSEAAWWVEGNCERCARHDDCPLLLAIDMAWFGDGYLSTGDAGRIWREGGVGRADCAEFERT